MKRIFLAVFGFLLSFALLVTYGWAAEWAPRNKVVFYQDYGCDTGNDLELGAGSYPDLRDYRTGGSGGQNWNDQISSMVIGASVTTVIVYEHINYGGRSKEFTRSWKKHNEDCNTMDEWWNDKISSVKIIGPGSSSPWDEPVTRDKAVFYQDGGCDGGNYVELEEGEYADLRELRVKGSGSSTWNDRISCMVIGSGISKVIVYEHVNFGGRSSVFTRSGGGSDSIQNIMGGWWDDKISSIKVIGTGSSSPWDAPVTRDRAVFYQDGGCDGGNYVELEEGEYADLRKLKVKGSGSSTWNDRISCMVIGSGISKVIVYEHVNFEGRSSVFTRSGWTDSIQNIEGGWWDDKISSIKVIGTESSKPWKKPIARDKAVFYQDDKCEGGTYVELREGEYPDLRELRVKGSGSDTWNDRISCITIGSEISQVIIYQHPNFEGKGKVLTRSSGEPDVSWSLLGGWSYKKISSIKVIGSGSGTPRDEPAPRNRAVFYQDNCGSGDRIELAKGEYPDLREFAVKGSSSATWNDRISCITIGLGINKVTVYEHPNFEGKSREFTRPWGGSDTNWSLSGLWCNDKVTSLKVQ